MSIVHPPLPIDPAEQRILTEAVRRARRASARQQRIAADLERIAADQKAILEQNMRIGKLERVEGDLVAERTAAEVIAEDRLRLDELTLQIRSGWGDVPGYFIPENWATAGPPSMSFIMKSRLASNKLFGGPVTVKDLREADDEIESDTHSHSSTDDEYQERIADQDSRCWAVPKRLKGTRTAEPRTMKHDPICRNSLCPGGPACRPDQDD